MSSSSVHDGLFSPRSVAWRLHADPVSLIGGMRALLIQALEPRAMAGVDQHSNFRQDPLGRFRNTASFLTTATFGSREEAERLGQTVRRIHRRVRGRDPVSGRTYRADDPELLAWVHNVLVHSVLAAQRRYGGGLSAADADRYVAEMTSLAELVGLDADAVPHTTGGLRVYLRRRPLVVSALAHEAKRAVLAPPLPARIRPLWALVDVGHRRPPAPAGEGALRAVVVATGCRSGPGRGELRVRPARGAQRRAAGVAGCAPSPGGLMLACGGAT